VSKPVNIAGKSAAMGEAGKLIPIATWRSPPELANVKSVEQFVQVYVRHQNRARLKTSRKHRQKLALELRARARSTCDFGLPIRQINEEIAVIEAGLERLIIAGKAA
jgi:hypothetical protein